MALVVYIALRISGENYMSKELGRSIFKQLLIVILDLLSVIFTPQKFRSLPFMYLMTKFCHSLKSIIAESLQSSVITDVSTADGLIITRLSYFYSLKALSIAQLRLQGLRATELLNDSTALF